MLKEIGNRGLGEIDHFTSTGFDCNLVLKLRQTLASEYPLLCPNFFPNFLLTK